MAAELTAVPAEKQESATETTEAAASVTRETVALRKVQDVLAKPAVVKTAQTMSLFGEHAGGWLAVGALVFFSTSVGCIAVLVIRRLTLGAELGGPRLWAWITCAFFILLWLIFVVLSSLKVSDII